MDKMYDMTITFHDRELDCNAELKINDSKNNPFKEDFLEHLENFENDWGKIDGITFKFK